MIHKRHLRTALALGAVTLFATALPAGAPARPNASVTPRTEAEPVPDSRFAIRCRLPPTKKKLHANAKRGLAQHLRQYPAMSLATPSERAAALRLLRTLRLAAIPWKNARSARAAGFNPRTVPRRPGDRSAHYLHAEHRLSSADRSFLNPRRPESLIYANMPGRPLVLVGAMFSVPRGVQGETPGGPITRWHSHLVCARGKRRGLAPRPDGTCPPGAAIRQGSEMMHVWFTDDLRSAFAIHAPKKELCQLGTLTRDVCRRGISPEM